MIGQAAARPPMIPQMTIIGVSPSFNFTSIFSGPKLMSNARPKTTLALVPMVNCMFPPRPPPRNPVIACGAGIPWHARREACRVNTELEIGANGELMVEGHGDLKVLSVHHHRVQAEHASRPRLCKQLLVGAAPAAAAAGQGTDREHGRTRDPFGLVPAGMGELIQL